MHNLQGKTMDWVRDVLHLTNQCFKNYNNQLKRKIIMIEMYIFLNYTFELCDTGMNQVVLTKKTI